jgi:hypothetical protein
MTTAVIVDAVRTAGGKRNRLQHRHAGDPQTRLLPLKSGLSPRANWRASPGFVRAS